MLSSMLGRTYTIAVNINIMCTFVRMLAATRDDLTRRLAELEKRTETLVTTHDIFSRDTRRPLKQVVDALRELMTPPDPPKRPIGFVHPEDKSKKASGSRGKTAG